MGEIILLTGGARSGKSSHALSLAKEKRGNKAFVATAVATDDEMRERIARHKAERETEFRTFEAPHELSGLLRDISHKHNLILIDCITFHINNLMFDGKSDDEILNECELTLQAIKNGAAKVIIVSNEVGCGLVPTTPLGRRFRDLHGKINQIIAEAADSVIFMVSGIPLKVK